MKLFLTDNGVLYLHNPKTGGHYIERLMASLFGGNIIGRHNNATKKQTARYPVVCGIRNPWTWYISYWAAGCDGHRRAIQVFHKKNNPKRWAGLYKSAKDDKAFRRWLKLMFMRASRHDWNFRGWANSGLDIGFCTYFLLFVASYKSVIKKPTFKPNMTELKTFFDNNCYVDYWIHQEDLTNDFIKVFDKLCGLTEKQKDKIRALDKKKINSSSWARKIDKYYDPETMELVESKDQLIIDKFGYNFSL